MERRLGRGSWVMWWDREGGRGGVWRGRGVRGRGRGGREVGRGWGWVGRLGWGRMLGW